ncbi:MAG TPA: glutathione S-transferase family protein [Alphaproteobacteria bacterium]|nr:glutathione S-transferase family protein [Alphaproteobacteria bacterium]
MRTLYHLWLSPPCRVVRVVLREKAVEFDLKVEKVWERRPEFLAINPAGEVPVLVESDGEVIAQCVPIAEYLEDVYPEPSLIGTAPLVRAEVRRLVDWFAAKFDHEVTEHILGEKFMKRFMSMGEPDSRVIRAGQLNIRYHLDYIAYLSERRRWLAGDDFSLADIAAAAHLSVIDYIGDVPWEAHPEAKEWYARVKSRPSFRPLLADRIPGAAPPKHYADLDF